MEKAYILCGRPDKVADVIKENRIRVERGWISFTPLEAKAEEPEIADSKEAPELGSTDDKSVTENDTKDVSEVDTKETKPAKKTSKSKKSE